ncbi:MAG: hypothetical protein MUO31_06865 [Thermodesulfovibrionales bacterium]|nr:hypothetical protein [Thermodesulfovibrionales bacterium]
MSIKGEKKSEDKCGVCGKVIDWDLCDPIIRCGEGDVILSCGHMGLESGNADEEKGKK